MIKSETFWLDNRQGQRVFIVYNHLPGADRPLALLAHGLSDVHDSAHMRAMLDGLLAAGYNVLRWDATNSWGRSGGSLDRATLTAGYHDMKDVVAWAATQSWYRVPFVLGGHSLGGAAALKFAAAHPELVDRLVLSAPAVAGVLLARRLSPVVRALWWLFGRLPEPGHRGKYYRYDLLHDGLRYDGRRLVAQIQMPTTLIAGGADRLIPVDHIRQLYDGLPQMQRTFVLIASADHTFRRHLAELKEAVQRAVAKI
jgi:pimeloyl-ACP methyl ester carboxylesterase